MSKVDELYISDLISEKVFREVDKGNVSKEEINRILTSLMTISFSLDKLVKSDINIKLAELEEKLLKDGRQYMLVVKLIEIITRHDEFKDMAFFKFPLSSFCTIADFPAWLDTHVQSIFNEPFSVFDFNRVKSELDDLIVIEKLTLANETIVKYLDYIAENIAYAIKGKPTLNEGTPLLHYPIDFLNDIVRLIKGDRTNYDSSNLNFKYLEIIDKAISTYFYYEDIVNKKEQ